MTYRYSRPGRDAKGEPSGGVSSGAFSFHCCTEGTIAGAPRRAERGQHEIAGGIGERSRGGDRRTLGRPVVGN